MTGLPKRRAWRLATAVTLAAVFVAVFSGVKPVEAGAAVSPDEEPPMRQPDSILSVYNYPEMRLMVDSAANIIIDTTGMLAPFLEKLERLQQGGDHTVSILHIGDSHVQAGFLTNRLREQFQRDFGNAGRGLIVPVRLAKMNEAPDYAVTTPYGYKARRATERGLDEKLGFTGIAVSFETPYNEFRLWSKEPFNGITVYHHPGAPALCEPDRLNIGTYCTIENTPTSTRIFLSESVDSLTVSGFTTAAYSNPTFYGFSLENGEPGVLYNAVGVNSAAFEHFRSNTTILEGGAAPLNPDVIVVSLGTNNCFGGGNFRRGDLYNCVDDFIRKLKTAYPGIPILMTTPMEACNRRSVRGRRTYVPNPNIAVAGEVIRQVSTDNEVACWDLYNAAGGEGVMASWFAGGLANGDRIHLTEKGYVTQGDIMYDAFAQYYNAFINRER